MNCGREGRRLTKPLRRTSCAISGNSIYEREGCVEQLLCLVREANTERSFHGYGYRLLWARGGIPQGLIEF